MSDHCPAFDECHYGGPGTRPICDTYCGAQHGAIWSEISDMDLGWPEKNALFEQRQRDELIPLTTYREDTHMITVPTPAEFLASSEPDEEEYAHSADPLDLLVDLERRVIALETGHSIPAVLEATACTECADLRDEAALLRDLHTDMGRSYAGAVDLVEQIEGIVKKSTSQVSLAVKDAIAAWRNPQTPSPAPDADPSEPAVDDAAGTGAPAPDVQQASAGEGSSHLEGAGENTGTAVLTQPETPDGETPDECWSVQEWRAHARSRGFTGPDVDTMNRSQIRTLLGIEQPVAPAGA